jgi:hypothetical protein
MSNDVWVTQQIDQVVTNKSGELDKVTVTVFLRSLGKSCRTPNEWMTPDVCAPLGRLLNQQAVTL